MAKEQGKDNEVGGAVRTPEGDNENAPDAPLASGDVNTDGLQPWPSIDTNKVAE